MPRFIREWWCRITGRHYMREAYGDLRADYPGGPATFREVYWRCHHCNRVDLSGCRSKFAKDMRKQWQ